MKELVAKVVSVHSGNNDDLSKEAHETIQVELDGIVGDAHFSAAIRAQHQAIEFDATRPGSEHRHVAAADDRRITQLDRRVDRYPDSVGVRRGTERRRPRAASDDAIRRPFSAGAGHTEALVVAVEDVVALEYRV